jgi:glycosyltransferase involved in cell wall biosynthesis
MRTVAMLQRRPYVWFAADVWSEAAGAAGAPSWVTSLLRRAESWVLTGASTVLSISDGVTEKVLALGVPPERIVTVGNGVDTSIFRPDGPQGPDVESGRDAFRQSSDATSDVPYFAYTGTVSEWQGAGVFIEALAEHRRRGGSSRLVILGQGSELPALRELAERLVPGSVHFAGVVPPHEAATWLRGASAALVSIKPGLGYDFAKPTKIYAATGCGTPVIYSGGGASHELVLTHGLGWPKDHDPAAVADAMDAATEGPRPTTAHLVNWTLQNASLRATCRVAAEAVLQRAGLA